MRVNPLVLIGLSIIALATSYFAKADTGLAMRCDGVTVATQAGACTGSRTWMHPVPGSTDAYLTFPTVPADSTTATWTDPTLQFQSWISIPGNAGVMTCTKDIPSPSVIPAGGVDPCAPGGDAVAKVYVPAAKVVTAVVATGGDTATLNWVAPATNLDGTPFTDLTGYYVWQGPSASALVTISGPTMLPPATSSFVVTGLSPGTYVFAVTAVNSKNAQSDPSPATFTDVKQTKPGQVIVTVTLTVHGP